MPDDASTNTPPVDPVQFFFSQLRGMTEQLARLGRIADALPVPEALRSISGVDRTPPLPGALTAAQLSATAAAVRSQRSSVQALQAQLSAFDEQLGVLESIVAPLAQWSSTWADVERSVMPGVASPVADSSDAGSQTSSGSAPGSPASGSTSRTGSTRSRSRRGGQEEKNSREKPPLR